MKKRLLQSEIDELYARGYEADTIAAMEFSEERTAKAERLIEQIRAAFAGVELGGGIGLWRGQGLDDYWYPECIPPGIYPKDETRDWSAIQVKHLNACHSSLSFFDAAGFRFHIPAFMIADLEETYEMGGVEFSLTHFDIRDYERYALLNGPQRRAVRAYLLFLVEEQDGSLFRPRILHALETYWTEESCENVPPPPPKPKREPAGAGKHLKGKAYQRKAKHRADSNL
jgi:hypothetical protein